MIFNKADNSLRGRNIYIDKKKRTIYYNKRTHKGYVISPGSERTFQVWSSRLALAVILAIFVEFFFLKGMWYVSIGLGVLTYVFLEYKYQKLLNSFPMIQEFDTDTAIPTEKTEITQTKPKLAIKAVLYVALGILLILNIYVSENVGDQIALVVISYAAAAVAFYIAIKFTILFLKK